MRKLKTFVFKFDESETDMDAKINDWVTNYKASIVSVQCSISSRPEPGSYSERLITIVYE